MEKKSHDLRAHYKNVEQALRRSGYKNSGKLTSILMEAFLEGNSKL